MDLLKAGLGIAIWIVLISATFWLWARMYDQWWWALAVLAWYTFYGMPWLNKRMEKGQREETSKVDLTGGHV